MNSLASKNSTVQKTAPQAQTAVPKVQSKLMVNAPGDMYEQEADAMAERVMHATGGFEPNYSTGLVGKSLQRKCAKCEEETNEKRIMRKFVGSIYPSVNLPPQQNGKASTIRRKCAKCEQEDEEKKKIMQKADDNTYSTPATHQQQSEPLNIIQRKCAKCEEEEEKKKKNNTLMRKSENSVGFEAPTDVSNALTTMQGGGTPIPYDTKILMENVFSTDFSQVRIHTDTTAADMNKSIKARAFTYGNDIYFNSGQFSTDSTEGKKLLAHELTHVRQQQGNIHRDSHELLEKPAQDFNDPISLNESILPQAFSNDQLLNEIKNIRDWLNRNRENTEQRMNLEFILQNLIREVLTNRPGLNPFEPVTVNFSEQRPWTFKATGNASDIAIAFEIYGGFFDIAFKRDEVFDFSTAQKEDLLYADPNLLKPQYKNSFHSSMQGIFEKSISEIEDILFELEIGGNEEARLISIITWWSETKDMITTEGNSYFDAFLSRLQNDKWYRDFGLFEGEKKPFLDLLFNEVEERSGELTALIAQNSIEFGGYRPLWNRLDVNQNLKADARDVQPNPAFVKRTADIILDALEGYTSGDDSKIIRDSIKGLPPNELAAVLRNIMKRYGETNWAGFGKYGEAWEGGMLYWLFEDLEDDDIPIVKEALKTSGVLSPETIEGLAAGRGWGGKYLPYTTHKASEAAEYFADCVHDDRRNALSKADCYAGGFFASLWLPETAGTTIATLLPARLVPNFFAIPAIKSIPIIAEVATGVGITISTIQISNNVTQLASGKDAAGNPLSDEDKLGLILNIGANAIFLSLGVYQLGKTAVPTDTSLAPVKLPSTGTSGSTASEGWHIHVKGWNNATGGMVIIAEHLPTGEVFKFESIAPGTVRMSPLNGGWSVVVNNDWGSPVPQTSPKGLLTSGSDSSQIFSPVTPAQELVPSVQTPVSPVQTLPAAPVQAPAAPVQAILPPVQTPAPAHVPTSTPLPSRTSITRVQVGPQDIVAVRQEFGIAAGADTLAVGRTDVSGLGVIRFLGASRGIRATASLPTPTPHIVSPRNNALFIEHAEQDVVNSFIDAVEDAGLSATDLEGKTLAIHISNPTGVCVACQQGAEGSLVDPGVLYQLSNRYPGLTIRVTWENAGKLENLIIVGGSKY